MLRDLAETLDHQAATSEILRVISSSPTDVQPVLEAVVEHAARLCDVPDAEIFEGRWDYGAIGTVTNLAARLCGEAKAGQILVSPRVAGAVEAQIELEQVGTLTLKGFLKPWRRSPSSA